MNEDIADPCREEATEERTHPKHTLIRPVARHQGRPKRASRIHGCAGKSSPEKRASHDRQTHGESANFLEGPISIG